LALAILIVNLERILYVKVLGYVLAHIQFDIAILKSMIVEHASSGSTESTIAGKTFDAIRKLLRFFWGVIIFLFILPIWPLIWIYNHLVQSVIIAFGYYVLMFVPLTFPGGFFVYYLLLATVTFLVSSITVPFIFQLSVYFRELFSLERKSWKQIHHEAKFAFLHFYQKLYGDYNQAMQHIKVRYADQYKAEGGVYYMLLKFLHFLKDKLWTLKEKKMEAVVRPIQEKTVEFVDEYFEEKNAYYVTLRSIAPKDLRRTVIALFITILVSVSLILRGTNGHGLIGPILLSFADQGYSQNVWINQALGAGYYEDMVLEYYFLPNFLRYIAIGFDQVFYYFFIAYYQVYPVYLNFLLRYYSLYWDAVVNIFWTTGQVNAKRI
jgi:hypothetical protein